MARAQAALQQFCIPPSPAAVSQGPSRLVLQQQAIPGAGMREHSLGKVQAASACTSTLPLQAGRSSHLI
jgi:hypothetical protein